MSSLKEKLLLREKLYDSGSQLEEEQESYSPTYRVDPATAPQRQAQTQASGVLANSTSYAPADPQTGEELQRLFDTMVTKSYLQRIDSSEVIKLQHEEGLAPMYWCQITKLVYEQDTFLPDKLAMLYAALHEVSAQVCLMVRYTRSQGVALYLGARDASSDGYYVSKSTLEAALNAYLPGVIFEGVSKDDVQLHIAKDNAVTSVSAISSLVDDKKEHFVQGLERLINAAASNPKSGSFTALFIADKVSAEQVLSMTHAYEQLSTQLSPLAEYQLNYSENRSEGITKGITEGFNESIAKNIGETVTDGTSNSSSLGRSTTKTKGTSTNQSPNAFKQMLTSVIGGVASTGESQSTSHGTTETETQGTSHSQATQRGETTTRGSHRDTSESTSEQTSTGLSYQQTYKNRQVQSYLDTLDKQIKRLQDTAPFGLWSTAAYFMADTTTETQALASIYRGNIIGEASGIETTALNTFPKQQAQTAEVLRYVSLGLHPRFLVDGVNVSAGSIVTSKEMALLFSLPQSSVPGVLVQERLPFGRTVTLQRPERQNEQYIELGCISHLGRQLPNSPVRLSVSELSKHTFVTGSTGSGKSNTLYLILEQLLEQGKKMLVIEPAKGEYQHVFGHRSDVCVLGTNPKKNELLRLNPFAFPDDIAVTEHIDQLVEIFNACWPMYAAMPAVLKAAVENAYKSCGWDLLRSESPYGLYPTMADVLASLRTYINESSYSEEVKSNYRGSLETRLESLTRGILGEVLGGREAQTDAELFEANVIIDLSRTTATETKALLMGLLILRLQEYRRASAQGMNTPLRHVTVLEEAHNLLKRTSTEQSSEGANLVGKSVEMITNGIAEMRTYGEGFIIVDQSPGMLDLAAIRNTNTKIVMALPEQSDREAAGRSLGLKEEQIHAISSQSLGQALVYQSHWEEAVQCQINPSKIGQEERRYLYTPSKSITPVFKPSVALLSFLLQGFKGRRYDFSLEAVRRELQSTDRLALSIRTILLRDLDSSDPLSSVLELDHNRRLGLIGSYLGMNDITSGYKAFAQRQDPKLRELLLKDVVLLYNER